MFLLNPLVYQAGTKEKSGKMAWISDVRYFKDEWYNHVLYLPKKDYTGGSNHFCELPDLMESIMDLTNRE